MHARTRIKLRPTALRCGTRSSCDQPRMREPLLRFIMPCMPTTLINSMDLQAIRRIFFAAPPRGVSLAPAGSRVCCSHAQLTPSPPLPSQTTRESSFVRCTRTVALSHCRMPTTTMMTATMTVVAIDAAASRPNTPRPRSHCFRCAARRGLAVSRRG